MTQKHILIVDDSKTELLYLSDILEQRGYHVTTAENANQALQQLNNRKPDLILMDVVMPGQNGFQLTRSLTKDPLFCDIPIVICTSKGQETDKIWGLRQGAKDYLIKPIQANTLLEKTKAMLG